VELHCWLVQRCVIVVFELKVAALRLGLPRPEARWWGMIIQRLSEHNAFYTKIAISLSSNANSDQIRSMRCVHYMMLWHGTEISDWLVYIDMNILFALHQFAIICCTWSCVFGCLLVISRSHPHVHAPSVKRRCDLNIPHVPLSAYARYPSLSLVSGNT
jgi:hypothetical protein